MSSNNRKIIGPWELKLRDNHLSQVEEVKEGKLGNWSRYSP